jgi:prepilin-type N-terminal cleavage/methylation domain-containing protein
MSITNKKAFTLIEMLVVVLIIGILAAIALPKYFHAVEKSRFATVWSTVKTIKEAQERYYMINSSYTANFDDLDISLPSSASVVNYQDWSTADIDGKFRYALERILISGSTMKDGKYYLQYQLVYANSSAWSGSPNAIMCIAWDISGETGKSICQELGGKLHSSNISQGQAYTAYKLSK